MIIIILLLFIIALPTLANMAGVGSALYFIYKYRYILYSLIAVLGIMLLTGKIKWNQVDYFIRRSLVIIMLIAIVLFLISTFSLFNGLGL